MTRIYSDDRSTAVAVWLFLVAALVFAMVVVGGITRLTGSGLSITEWKPIMGAIPPLSDADWNEAFEKYRQIPQYREVNAGMSLGEFQFIFWWEWVHRFLGRVIGLVYAVPFLFFTLVRYTPLSGSFPAMPSRLAWRGWVLLAMGALQGLIGWWMVSSGLADRVDVAPERLMVHLGLAFLILIGLIWTGLEAHAGRSTVRPSRGWTLAATLILVGVVIQCLIGALVAGSKAGMIYTDWPLMNGALLAPVDWSMGALVWLHDQALVQFLHRMWGYLLLLGVLVYGLLSWTQKVPGEQGLVAALVVGSVIVQAVLGIVTLMLAVPLTMGVIHQGGAAIVVALATVNLWVVRRSQPRMFVSYGIGSRGP